ncbi:zinc-binding dehydrogenase [Streptomyces sp. NPDC005533]|uniref:zinc-binding dehydrogenase n=1 Tax=Streptomyces sp. NPDC005533 TaxID=3364723 RepID=UPI0036A175E2
MAAGGLLRPALDTVLPLADAAEAHERADGRRTTGKIVHAVATARERSTALACRSHTATGRGHLNPREP